MPDTTDGSAWEASWEIRFPASTIEELLLALVVRDLVHSATFDLELEESRQGLAVDYVAGDEIEGGFFNLLVTAQVAGPEQRDLVQQLTEDLLEELVAEAEQLVAEARHLGSMPVAELAFEAVGEALERWDLVVPDWLAPDGAEVPFGFRPLLASKREPWPTDAELDLHGRVVLVAHGDEAHLYAIPAPGRDRGELPVLA